MYSPRLVKVIFSSSSPTLKPNKYFWWDPIKSTPNSFSSQRLKGLTFSYFAVLQPREWPTLAVRLVLNACKQWIKRAADTQQNILKPVATTCPGNRLGEPCQSYNNGVAG